MFWLSGKIFKVVPITSYRLLRDNDDITKGLSAKQPNAKEDVATHVATESKRGYSSQNIATCANLYKAESFRSLKLNSGDKWGMKHIAEIDVESLPGWFDNK